MEILDRKSLLWEYLGEETRALINDGEILLDHAVEPHKVPISDYSYLVFPFSKAYEGFLKALFLDLGLIREDEFYSDDIRIGKMLNPNFIKERHSVFARLCHHSKGDNDISTKLWKVWRRGRNQVFHFFPHNFRKLSYAEALEIIQEITDAMRVAVSKCDLRKA